MKLIASILWATLGGGRATLALIQDEIPTAIHLCRLFVRFVLVALNSFPTNHAPQEINGEEMTARPRPPARPSDFPESIPRNQASFENWWHVLQRRLEEFPPEKSRLLSKELRVSISCSRILLEITNLGAFQECGDSI